MPKSVNFLCLEPKLSRARARKFDAIKRKNPIEVVCGHDRLSAAGGLVRARWLPREGCTVVHDRERARNGVFRDDTTESEAFKV